MPNRNQQSDQGRQQGGGSSDRGQQQNQQSEQKRQQGGSEQDRRQEQQKPR